MNVGDLVKWKPEIHSAPHAAMEVIGVYPPGENRVRLAGGSTAAISLLQVITSAQPLAPDAGLLEVIDTQMAEIDRLQAELRDAQITLEYWQDMDTTP